MKLIQQLERLATFSEAQLQRVLDDMPSNRLVLLAKVGQCSGRPEFSGVVRAMGVKLDEHWSEVSTLQDHARRLMHCLQASAPSPHAICQYA